MKLEFVKPGAGFGFGYNAGDVGEISDKDAEKLIEAGIAIPAKQKSETADLKVKPEKAVKK